MTIHLAGEVVASRYDAQTRQCFYTIERDGKRWTISQHVGQLDQHGKGPQSKSLRQMHIARLLTGAMAGPHDGEKK